jgi:hypothetical protein
MTSDDRMTGGLIRDVFDVLERHGYRRHDNQHTAQAIGVIVDLASIYDGTHDASFRGYSHQAPSAQYAEPGPPGPEADDAAILTDAEASTVFGALEIAADYKRDRAASCSYCAGQTCLTCQSRLQDAQAYDRMADQLLQTAEAARTAKSYQPEPDGPPASLYHPHRCAAEREAGQ